MDAPVLISSSANCRITSKEPRTIKVRVKEYVARYGPQREPFAKA